MPSISKEPAEGIKGTIQVLDEVLHAAPQSATKQEYDGVYQRSAAYLAFEIFGIVLALVLVLFLSYRCYAGVMTAWAVDAAAGKTLLLVLAGSVFCGYLLADFGSGVVHFTFDRFFSTQTPILGKNFVHPFRQHHSDPKHITRHDFCETNGNNCLATCPFLIALALMPFDYTVGWHAFVVGLFVFASVGTFATNQFHKWAHEREPPKWVAWLQEKHLILPRDHHQIHHTHPYDTHYCITTGWLNAMLSKLHFWRFLEIVGERVMRMPPFTEATPWERVTGSPAFIEREQMAELSKK